MSIYSLIKKTFASAKTKHHKMTKVKEIKTHKNAREKKSYCLQIYNVHKFWQWMRTLKMERMTELNVEKPLFFFFCFSKEYTSTCSDSKKKKKQQQQLPFDCIFLSFRILWPVKKILFSLTIRCKKKRVCCARKKKKFTAKRELFNGQPHTNSNDLTIVKA